MTQAFDAATRAAFTNISRWAYNETRPKQSTQDVARQTAIDVLHAALPAEPPEWFGAWWDNGWELSDEAEALSAYHALRAHLLGESA